MRDLEGPSRRSRPTVTWLGVGLVCAACASPADPRAAESLYQRFAFGEAHMGTAWRIDCYAIDEAGARAAAAAAFARIAELDVALSDWDPNSELSRAPRQGPGPVAVGEDLAAVLREARAIAGETGGAFDITIGPVVRLWRRALRQQGLPAAERLAEAIARVGWEHVTVDGSTATFAVDGMQLDAGGIAKGFAAREALRVLREHGVERALVDAGGDMALGEPPPGAVGWEIGLQPLAEGAAGGTVLTLANRGVATSGDAFRFVEIDGTRYSHIVDPRTGLGLTTRISVTALHPDPARADAYASALCVMGPADGIEFAAHTDGLEALVTWIDAGGTFRQRATPGFPSTVAVRVPPEGRR